MSDSQKVTPIGPWQDLATVPTIVDNHAERVGLAAAYWLLASERCGEAVGAALAAGEMTWAEVGEVTGLGRRRAAAMFGRFADDARMGLLLDTLPAPVSLGDVMVNLRAAGALS